MAPVRIQHLAEMKRRGERIAMLTAYDFPTAQIFDAAGIDVILVGDSVGDNMLGHRSTIPVTLDEIALSVRSVARAVTRALVVADLPFGTYEASPEAAFDSAARLMKAGANAVKLEGGARMARQVELLSRNGIPVMGHVGLTPQSENVLGGRKVQGRGNGPARQLHDDAVALSEAGCFAVVLEAVPAPLAAAITAHLDIPTIGIGAGPDCDGQVLVWTDMAGLTASPPRFAKAFGSLRADLTAAAQAYAAEVRAGTYPDAAHSFE